MPNEPLSETQALRNLLEEHIRQWEADKAERERREKTQRLGIIEFSNPFVKLAAALVAARKAFGKITMTENATITPKDGGRSYSYKYADLPGVLAATAGPLAENGIVCLQGATTSENGQLVTIETMLLHETAEWCRTRLSMRVANNTPQGIGSAITYARRYALQSLLGVSPEDDDGKTGSQGGGGGDRGRQQQNRPAAQQPAATQKTEGAPAGMKNAIRQLMTFLSLGEGDVVGEMTNGAKKSVDELTAFEGNALLTNLQRRKRETGTQKSPTTP